jgi:hypothetical protein
MKSLFDLIKTDKKFALYLVILAVFFIWAWFRGFRIVIYVMLAIVAVAVAVNLWKNYS